MMNQRRAYLLGGSVAHGLSAADFVAASGGCRARIGLLMRGGEKSRNYIPQYADPWKQRGALQVDVIMSDEDGRFYVDDVLGKGGATDGWSTSRRGYSLALKSNSRKRWPNRRFIIVNIYIIYASFI